MSRGRATAHDANDASLGGGPSSADHVCADGGNNGDDDNDSDWVLDAYRAVCRDAEKPPTVRGLAVWRDHVLRSCLRASSHNISLLLLISSVCFLLAQFGLVGRLVMVTHNVNVCKPIPN
jgi:hypothetical protein